MEVSGHLYGGAPQIRKYQIAETFADAGVFGTIDATTEAGVNLGTTSNAVDMVGVTLDAGTYSVVQGVGANSAETLVTFSVRPDVIIRARMSGSTSSGTSLAVQTETTGETAGLVIITGASWTSPTFLDGVVWGLSGNNVGQSRKITTVDGTGCIVDVPFDNDILSGDTYLRTPIAPNESIVVEFTTDITEVAASEAISANAEFAVLDLDLNGVADSYAYLIPLDHMLNPN